MLWQQTLHDVILSSDIIYMPIGTGTPYMQKSSIIEYDLRLNREQFLWKL